MNYFAWLQFVQVLATTWATSHGRDVRALGYLRIATSLFTGQLATHEEFETLKREYTDKVMDNTPTTPGELAALDAALAARSAAIQA